nr:helix-turn-helix transcriptional regulator [uncultured Adlercreutzia sp.]
MDLQLKKLRTLKGLSQDEMAEKLGVKTSRYGTRERGERMLSLKQAYDCAVILGCSIDAIAGYTPPVSYSDPAQEALNGYWESMNADGRERLLGIAELAADGNAVRVQKSRGMYEYRPRWKGARR